MIRRTALVALAIAAVLAPSASAASKKPPTLDGQRATSYSYHGTLAGPTVFTGLLLGKPNTEPDPSWCSTETCDQTEIALTLPVGRLSGRLVVELTQAAESSTTGSMHFVVYDAEDRPLPGQACCAATRFVATRMPKGTIKVVVYDDAGTVSFGVDVSWKANPPHRTTPNGSGG
jgi:hypothetical protein